jgi:succinate dehydrogenase / fumarate reductase cytochrome b subunit
MLQSSIARKIVVAITGLALLLFVVGHLLGNLQVFLGQEAINSYAEKLASLGPLLWVVRLGLLAVAVVHVWLTLGLAAENRSARPQRYQVAGRVQTTATARTMTWTGLVILAFVLFHLAHLTWRLTHPEYNDWQDALGRPDVYRMMVAAFQEPLLAGLYMLAVALLGMHLIHGASSFFQSMGWNHPRYRGLTLALGPVLGALLALGYLSIPAAILLGIVTLPPGVA